MNKNFAVFSLILIVAASTPGCSQQRDTGTTDANNKAPANQEPSHLDKPTVHREQNHRGGDHHAFADPDELAKSWNDSDRDIWQHPEQIIEALSLKPGASVADIGAGTGYMVAHLSKSVGKDGTVIAVDAEPAMIEYLTKHIGQLGPAKVVPQKVGFNDPELPAESVDGVLILDTWHHVAGRVAYAQKVHDGLKTGGRFVVVDYEVDSEVGPPKTMRLSPERVTKQLEAAGFRVEVVKESMPRHYLVVGIKD